MTIRKLTGALLAATVLGGVASAGAFAQDMAPMFDPDQLPAIHGTVAQYDLTPRGDVDGLILADGVEVHFPPSFGTQIVAAVRPGDQVTVHGLEAHAIPLVRALSVTAEASGNTVITENQRPPRPGRRPPPPPGRGQQMHDQGPIKMQLHGPGGELNGALLQDGTMVHLPPPEAARLADLLKPGQIIAVQGRGVATDLGRSIAAEQIGPSPERLTQIAAPRPRRHGPPPGGLDAPPPPPPPGAGPG